MTRSDLFSGLALGKTEGVAPVIRGNSSHKKRRLPPLSIRLNAYERADLVARAGDIPVSAYAKSLLFTATAKPMRLSPRNPTLDHQILGQLLGTLGRMSVAAHLEELATAARSGSLLLDEVTMRQLHEACHDIALIRTELLNGLGVRSQQ